MNDVSVYLRSLEVTDIEKCHKWHNDHDLNRYFGSAFRFVSHFSEEEWIRKKVAYSLTEINLAICLTSTQEHIGNAYIRDINWVNRNAEIHIFIGEKNLRGRGYGTAALHLIIKHCFYDINLERLYLHVFKENIAAIKCYLKTGFVVEGTLKRHYFKDYEFKDVMILGLLREEYINSTINRSSSEKQNYDD